MKFSIISLLCFAVGAMASVAGIVGAENKAVTGYTTTVVTTSSDGSVSTYTEFVFSGVSPIVASSATTSGGVPGACVGCTTITQTSVLVLQSPITFLGTTQTPIPVTATLVVLVTTNVFGNLYTITETFFGGPTSVATTFPTTITAGGSVVTSVVTVTVGGACPLCTTVGFKYLTTNSKGKLLTATAYAIVTTNPAGGYYVTQTASIPAVSVSFVTGNFVTTIGTNLVTIVGNSLPTNPCKCSAAAASKDNGYFSIMSLFCLLGVSVISTLLW